MTIASELRGLLGHDIGGWTVEPLVHNRSNAVTASIERVRVGDWSAVLKVLAPPRMSDLPAEWAASDEPSHWNYWRREADIYEHSVPAAYAGSGIRAPALLACHARTNGDLALWLEDVVGTPGSAWPAARYAAAASALGRAQGRLALDGSVPVEPWLSRGFLRAYAGSKLSDWALLDDDDAWRQPLVRDHFPAGLREQMVGLHRDRERLISIVDALPRTLCHLDVWPNNLIATSDSESVLVDWSFAGEGALGEDAGSLIPEAVFDGFLAAEHLPELDELIYRGYVAGFRDAGWDGDERLVRLAMCASAIKYDWLVPRLLERAGTAEHFDYGGTELVSAELRYAERGATFAFLAGWADEARALALELGR